jgi:PilZ domain
MSAAGGYMGFERREVERYKVNLPVRWEGRRATREGTITDISIGGCFVLADDLIDRGDPVKIELLLPAGAITLWGHVIYTAEEIGFGVRFSPATPEAERRKLELLIRAEALRSQKKRGG